MVAKKSKIPAAFLKLRDAAAKSPAVDWSVPIPAVATACVPMVMTSSYMMASDLNVLSLSSMPVDHSKTRRSCGIQMERYVSR